MIQSGCLESSTSFFYMLHYLQSSTYLDLSSSSLVWILHHLQSSSYSSLSSVGIAFLYQHVLHHPLIILDLELHHLHINDLFSLPLTFSWFFCGLNSTITISKWSWLTINHSLHQVVSSDHELPSVITKWFLVYHKPLQEKTFDSKKWLNSINWQLFP